MNNTFDILDCFANNINSINTSFNSQIDILTNNDKIIIMASCVLTDMLINKDKYKFRDILKNENSKI